MTYKQSVLKQQLEYILIFPIVAAGMLYGKLKKPKKPYTYFLFFSSADIGGSIKVNADIANCIRDKEPLIIFSKKPKNNKFRHMFQIPGVDILDLAGRIDNKLFHFVNIFYRGVLAAWINATGKSVVFGGESLYFYKMIPHLSKHVKLVELCHLNTWFNYSQAFVKRIDARVFSTPKIKRDAEELYRQNSLPAYLHERLYFTDNMVKIPVYRETKNEKLEILFVGRGAPQKRVHLLVKIMMEAHKRNFPVHFTFVGDVEHFFNEENKKLATLSGEIKEREILDQLYEKSDVLMLTSAYEGLPLVVMDMMARGKIIISTDVDGIPDYITHLETGLLIKNGSEKEITEQGLELLQFLISNPEKATQIKKKSRQFSIEHFGESHFKEFYGRLLKPKQ